MAEPETLLSEPVLGMSDAPADADTPAGPEPAGSPTAPDIFELASHRLNTPLSCIRGFVSTLLQRGEQLDPQTRRQFLEVVLEQAERLQMLGRDMLTMARLRTGVDPAPKPCQPRDLLATLPDEAGPDAPKLRLEGDLDQTVWVDQELLLLALRPLVENAVCYGPRLGPIRIVVTAGAGEVRWAVVDTGTWLTGDELPRLFAPFRRSENPVERRGSGAGLGLAVAATSAATLGGSVGAAVDAQGTTFWVTTPSGPTTADDAGATERVE